MSQSQVQTPEMQPSSEGVAPSSPPAQSAAPLAASAEVVRPEYLPEQFWDAQTKAPKLEDFGRAYSELAAFKAGEDSRRAAAPETADLYALNKPADLALPEGMEWEFDDKDPRFALGREIAHRMGLDQNGFEQQLLKPFIEFEAQRQADEAGKIEDMTKAQSEALGPKADDRRAAVKNFMAAVAGPKAVGAIEHFLPVADFVVAMEAVMRRSTGGVAPFSQGGREAGKAEISEEEYAAMSPADRLTQARRATAGAAR